MKRDWLQIITNIGVVFGLLLLLYELNQSRDLTRAQVVDSLYETVVIRSLSLIGETPEAAIARSIFQPDELTESEAVVLSQFYTSLLVSWLRNKDESGAGFFGQPFTEVVASEAYYLNSEPGRRWWAVVGPNTDPAIAAAVDEALASMSVDAQRVVLETILGRVSNAREGTIAREADLHDDP
ncbi:MAG: hypothetical protein AAGE43_08875 [Pseudomonadota bacterium]